MVYRDDMSALKARCEALEEELERARIDLSRLDEVEWEKAHLEDRVADLEHQLLELRSQMSPRTADMLAMQAARRAAAIFAALSLAMVGGFTLHMIGIAHRQQIAELHYRSMADHARLAEMEAELAQARGKGSFHHHGVIPTRGPDGAYQAVSRTGRITVATGEAPATAGTTCRVDAVPTFDYDGFNCRLEVTCGGQMLYGGPFLGYMMCGYEGGVPSYGTDDGVTRTDGDPRLTLDMPNNRVVVSDGPGPRYSISIALDRP